MPSKIVSLSLSGRELTLETGRLAQQARGSVLVRYGDTVVLVTACAEDKPQEGVDFLPLTVDYEERLYAAGKIPGSFFRREGRPTQEAVTTGRLVDRAIRPLFPKDFRNAVQVIIAVLSVDKENEPDLLALIGASAALGISGIPFNGPVAGVRVGYVDGQLKLNPVASELVAKSSLDLIVASTSQAVVMLEAGAAEVSEEIISQGIQLGMEANQKILQLQQEMVLQVGRPKMSYTKVVSPGKEAEEALAPFLDGRLEALAGIKDKIQREKAQAALEGELSQKKPEISPKEIHAVVEANLKALFRDRTLKGERPDGRGYKDIRSISAAVGILPRTHGSGLFTRGLTQLLTITTLGSGEDEQRLDTIGLEESKRFIHHYNFPPYSSGEVKRLGSPSRREVGHGAMVERALLPVIPPEEEFPYTIRLVSEVLSSNGSTSMASVCSSNLALMDAGVPIKRPVAGIAMGLVTGANGKYAILTDIEGTEDAYGDMDFKVAGTRLGITALQLDIKLQSVSAQIIEEALRQAREARLFIMDKMAEVIKESRPNLSAYAPRLVRIRINPDKIGAIIGPGGKTIRSISEKTKTELDVENDGTIFITGATDEDIQRAISLVKGLAREVTVGEIYTGRVTRVTNFGAFVEILPGLEGLVPISELAEYKVARAGDVVQVGDEIMVTVTEIDRQGRVNLSRRAVYQGPSQKEGEAPPPVPAPQRFPPKPTFGDRGRPFPGQRRQPPHP